MVFSTPGEDLESRDSGTNCIQRLQLISPRLIGLVPLLQIQASSVYRPTPQCIDFCHSPPNPDGISAEREDLLVPAERQLPAKWKGETCPAKLSVSLLLVISTLEETLSDVSG